MCLAKNVLVKSIRNDLVVGVRPERGELKAVAGLFALVPPLAHLLDVAAAGGIGIILRVRAVGNDKDLHILIKTAGRPKTVALVALDLVERLADGDTAALEFDMYHGQAIDQHRHVIAHIVRASALLILVDDLKEVIVNILFVDEIDIFRRAAVLPQHLHMVVLDLARLFHDALVGTGNAALEKALPLRIGEGVVVQLFQLAAQIGDERRLVVDSQVFIALRGEHTDELAFQRGLALVAL